MIDIRCDDAVSLLGSLPPESVDLIFTDPPFNLGFGYDVHKDDMPDAEYMAWCRRWLGLAARSLKPTGSMFILNIPRHAIRLAAYMMDMGLYFQHSIAWEAVSRPASGKPLMPVHYSLLYFTKSESGFTVNEVRMQHRRCRHCNGLIADYGGHADRMNDYGPIITDVWTDIARAKHSEREGHPCRLPPKLLDRVIRLASNTGDLVVDPFLGSGTTAEVCKHLHRDFIGGDLSPAYVEMAERRVSQITPFLFWEQYEEFLA